jgi:hypothetical protein
MGLPRYAFAVTPVSALIFLSLFGCTSGSSQLERERRDAFASAAPLGIPLSQLVEESRRNDVAATVRYKGRLVIASGVVSGVVGDEPHLLVTVGGFPTNKTDLVDSHVFCHGVSLHQAMNLSKQESEVTIAGVLTKLSLVGWTLNPCKIVKHEFTPEYALPDRL